MLFVLIIAAALWGIGHLMKASYRARFFMLGLLFLGVLTIQLTLPLGHPLREMTGGSPALWLMLAGAGVLIFGYSRGIGRMRRRADVLETQRSAQSATPTGLFSDVELERYARHITLRQIGGGGQRALKNAKVLVIGAGGLGSPVLLYLAAAGVGTIGVIDDDTVDLSNLQRQIIHTDDRVDMPKIFSAEIAVNALNPFVTVKPYQRKLTEDIAAELFADYDLILDGTDTFATRAMVNRAAQTSGRPVITGAISAWEGQITLYDPASGAPCMACIFPTAPDPELAATCAETGVIGALPGIIGSIMAAEAIKEITGAGQGLRGRMIIYDALDAQMRVIVLKRHTDCPVCGDA
jgi:molybdopterin/thiamine biosynthesis adenylyltransferase